MHGGARLRGRFLALLPAAALLGGCGSAVPLDPAPEAADPECAAVIASLEGADEVAGRARREVGAQSAAAWGEPPLVLRCGVESPGPTTEGCVSVNGVDWVGPTDPSDGGTWTTYGRDPAVEVIVPRAAAGDATLDVVLAQVSPAVAALPQQRQCF